MDESNDKDPGFKKEFQKHNQELSNTPPEEDNIPNSPATMKEEDNTLNNIDMLNKANQHSVKESYDANYMPTYCELKTEWLEELNDSANVTPVLWSTNQYANQCDEFNNSLRCLLFFKMRNTYASLSQLFKWFRYSYKCNRKLKNKVFELRIQMQSLKKGKDQFEKQVLEKEKQIKYLEDNLENERIRGQLIEKTKDELESQLEELQSKSKKAKDIQQFEMCFYIYPPDSNGYMCCDMSFGMCISST
ncbi:hypothetical protein CDAR_126831 [Caerostris darwini]|uniref:Uncharacterized protein n=1 Tax=Caerostris darwini TaxID=1538125 RepID=A0AAV4RGI1_9ARAC|nr:hypothetical protein CDAR_126831 [Caerostris darwini]